MWNRMSSMSVNLKVFSTPNDLHQPPRQDAQRKKRAAICGRMNALVRRFLAD